MAYLSIMNQGSTPKLNVEKGVRGIVAKISSPIEMGALNET